MPVKPEDIIELNQFKEQIENAEDELLELFERPPNLQQMEWVSNYLQAVLSRYSKWLYRSFGQHETYQRFFDWLEREFDYDISYKETPKKFDLLIRLLDYLPRVPFTKSGVLPVGSIIKEIGTDHYQRVEMVVPSSVEPSRDIIGTEEVSADLALPKVYPHLKDRFVKYQLPPWRQTSGPNRLILPNDIVEVKSMPQGFNYNPVEQECSSEFADRLGAEIDQLEIEAVRMFPCTTMKWVKDSLQRIALERFRQSLGCEREAYEEPIYPIFEYLTDRLRKLNNLFVFINTNGIDITQIKDGSTVYSSRGQFIFSKDVTVTVGNLSGLPPYKEIVKKFPQIAPYLLGIYFLPGTEQYLMGQVHGRTIRVFPEELIEVAR